MTSMSLMSTTCITFDRHVMGIYPTFSRWVNGFLLAKRLISAGDH